MSETLAAAEALAAAGQPGRALLLLAPALATALPAADVLRCCARLAEARGDPEAAIEALARAARLHGAPEDLAAAVHGLLALTDAARAAALATEVAQLHPPGLPALLAEVDSAVLALAAAVARFGPAEAADPALIRHCLTAADQPGEAVLWARRALMLRLRDGAVGEADWHDFGGLLPNWPVPFLPIHVLRQVLAACPTLPVLRLAWLADLIRRGAWGDAAVAAHALAESIPDEPALLPLLLDLLARAGGLTHRDALQAHADRLAAAASPGWRAALGLTAPPPPGPVCQVFIIGAARSGTSALFEAVSGVLGLPGYGESHVLPAFQRMVHSLRQYVEAVAPDAPDILLRQLMAAPVEHALAGFARDFYRAAYGGDSFVDKTPTGEAVHGALLIEQLFPAARLIVARRTGIETVQSHRLKFASGLEAACHAWVDAMSGLLLARGQCRRMIEIDQFDMANAPAATGARLADFLGCPAQAEGFAAVFAQTRIERSSSHDWSRRQTLADTGWTAGEQAAFRTICGPMMREFGYPM